MDRTSAPSRAQLTIFILKRSAFSNSGSRSVISRYRGFTFFVTARVVSALKPKTAVSYRRTDTQGRTGPFHHWRYCFKASLRFACGMRNTKSRTGTPYGWLCRHKAYRYPIIPYFDCIFNLNILRRFLPPNSVWLSQFCLCGSGCGSNEKTAAN